MIATESRLPFQLYSWSRSWLNDNLVAPLGSALLIFLAWFADLAGGETLSTASYLTAIFVGANVFGRHALEQLVFARRIGIDLLMAVAAATAATRGHIAEAAALVFLYSLSLAAEAFAAEKMGSAMRSMLRRGPKTVLVRRNGSEISVPVEQVTVGDICVVKPGETIPTDGVVIEGRSSVGQSSVTGEGMPVEKQPGDAIFAGSDNVESTLAIRTTATTDTNLTARVVHLMETVRAKRGKSARFIERFGARYSPLVLLVAVALAVLPPLFGGDWHAWTIRATTFIVAAAPCALVISVPVALVTALGAGARRGVLAKGGLYVEALARIKVLALDKTGTLTTDEPKLTDLSHWSRAIPVSEMIALAADVEQHSRHPVAGVILDYAASMKIAPRKVSGFRRLVGVGVVATTTQRGPVYVTQPSFFAERGLLSPAQTREIARLEADAKTVVVVGDEKEAWGLMALRYQLHPGARKALADLRALGIAKIVILTSNHTTAAEVIGREAGADEIHAGLKPKDKALKVRELSARYGDVGMVGSGVSDVPALAEAAVGIAIGPGATDIVLQMADVALVGDGLGKLVDALRLARRSQKVVRQNLVFSFVIVGVLAVGALLGAFSLPMAIVAHEVGELVVIGAAMRLLWT